MGSVEASSIKEIIADMQMLKKKFRVTIVKVETKCV